MNDEDIKLKGEASFEIISFGDEDEIDTSSLNTSTLGSNWCETKSSSSALSERDGSMYFEKKSERGVKHSFSTSLVPHFDLEISSLNYFNADENKRSEDFLRKYIEDSVSQTTEDDIDFYNSRNSNISFQLDVDNRHELGIQDGKIKHYYEREMSETYSEEGSLHKSYTFPVDKVREDILIPESATDIRNQKTYNSNPQLNFERAVADINNHNFENPSNTDVKLYPERKNYNVDLCPFIKHSLKIYKWFRSNTYLQNLVAEAKSSFHTFLNKFELDPGLDAKSPIRILLICNSEESFAIKEAFLETFNGRVIVSRCSQIEDPRVPVLPIGYNSALLAAQSKIVNARGNSEITNYKAILTSINFVVENTPQRWQMSTVLYLEDLNLGMNLYNFSSTTPIPNEYIFHAQRLTPEDYSLKKFGLAVTLQETIRSMTRIDINDIQEFLSGVSRFLTLKSTASVLVGMYLKYIKHLI